MGFSILNLPFIVYDLLFLAIFILVVGILLYRNRKNIKREMGIGILYKAKWGIKFIEYIGGKYKKTLNFLKFVIIPLGFVLMALMIFILARGTYAYIRFPSQLAEMVPAPPLAPVIPYFPSIFGVSDFFPEFSVIYFILSLGIVATVHEFSHGVFMKRFKVRIKSTGVFFLGPFFGAFVEQNQKDLEKAKKTDQMAILGAGVFANVVTGAVFLVVWAGLFFVTFTPAGATFDGYIQTAVNVSQIQTIGNINVNGLTGAQMLSLIKEQNLSEDLILSGNGGEIIFTKIAAEGKTYFMTQQGLIEQLNTSRPLILLYGDYPAIENGLRGTIIQADGLPIKDFKDFEQVLDSKNPGDVLNLKTDYNGQTLDFSITLVEHPSKPGEPLIGIAQTQVQTNIAETLALSLFKQRFTEYQTTNAFLEFLYFLVFWIMLINFLVAMFNMLPFAILDGGRFFYLAVWGVTKNEKIGKIAYKWAGIIIIAMFALMMLGWLIGWLGNMFFVTLPLP